MQLASIWHKDFKGTVGLLIVVAGSLSLGVTVVEIASVRIMTSGIARGHCGCKGSQAACDYIVAFV